ncbi:MAG TPA: hypothetical protein VK658_07235 [Chryseolinea sp.]|nr:hypothetical protein [Chryseolinea sp.]
MKFAASLLLVAGAGAIWLSIQPGTPAASTVAENQAPAPDSAQLSRRPNANEAAATDPAKTDTPVAAFPTLKAERTASDKLTSTDKTAIPSSRPNRQAMRSRKPGGQKPSLADASNNNDTAMRNSENHYSSGSRKSEARQNEMPAVTDDAHMTPVAAVSQSVTLTYTADDVSAYLDKNVDGEATDDDKKQSTLKKLLQKANDLKTNQDPFGELRQRKNEILALNFKNDKRGQKTRN